MRTTSDGIVSVRSRALTARTDAAPDTAKPTAPGNPRANGTSQTSVTLAWDAATDNVGVTGYEVRDGATAVATVTGTSATVANLTPDTEYTFTVVAKDAAGNTSDASAPVTARTQKRDSTIIEYGYDLKGKTKIKAAIPLRSKPTSTRWQAAPSPAPTPSPASRAAVP